MRTWSFFTVLWVLVATAALMRIGSFGMSVLNHDESTYIVIAEEMLRGKQYLRDVVDTKPIGLFWLYESLVWLSAKSIWWIRLLTSLFVGATAACWWWTTRRVTHSVTAAWGAAICYIALCSVFTYFGLSPNTELFFNFFTASGIAIMVGRVYAPMGREQRLDWPAFVLVGLCLGTAVIIKPVAAAEALAIGLFLLWRGWKENRWWRAILDRCLPMTLAFGLPLAIVYAHFAELGLLDELRFYSYEMMGRYPVDRAWWERLLYLGDYLRFLPVLLLALWPMRFGAEVSKEDRIRLGSYRGFLLLTALIVTIVMLVPGKTFGHYMVQLHPLTAALFGLWWVDSRIDLAGLRKKLVRWGLPIALLTVGGYALAHTVRYLRKYDQAREVAEWLELRLHPEEEVFMENIHQIVYSLLDRPVPTPYVHSSLLFYPHHIAAFGIDLEREAQRLIDNQNVRYVVRRNRQPELYNNAITRAIDAHFSIMQEFDHELDIWVRNP